MTLPDPLETNARATHLLDSGRLEEAVAILEAGISPSGRPHPVLATNLARLIWRRGWVDRAVALLEGAVAEAPGMAAAWLNLADARAAADGAGAAAAYRRAIALMPGAADLHWSLAAHLLVQGEDARAWPHFHWRHRDPRVRQRPAPFPRIEALDRLPRRLLLWSNEGIGEDLRYAALLPALAAQGARIVLEADPRLVPLFRRSFPRLEIAARAWPPAPPTADSSIGGHATLADLLPLMSHGRLPAAASYLRPDPDVVARLRARYRGGEDDPLIGVSWASRKTPFAGAKSLDPSDLAPVLARRATWVSLQYADEGESDGRLVRDRSIDPLVDLDAFAAQVAAMDLVVTTSSTTAHMAGALGVPVWVMVHRGPPITPYWRAGRSDVAWYPAMRVWRQAVPGCWTDVVAAIAAALDRWLADRPRQGPGRA